MCVAGALRARCSPSSPLSHLPAAPSQERAALESGSDEEGEEKESPLLKKAKKAGAKTISCLLGCGANFRSDEKAKAHETECFKRQQGLKAREQNLPSSAAARAAWARWQRPRCVCGAHYACMAPRAARQSITCTI